MSQKIEKMKSREVTWLHFFDFLTHFSWQIRWFSRNYKISIFRIYRNKVWNHFEAQTDTQSTSQAPSRDENAENEEQLNRDIAWYLGRDTVIQPSDFDRTLRVEEDIGQEKV